MDIKHVIRLFQRKLKREGFSEAFRQSFKKIFGITRYERELDTLYHIVNHCIDITKIPPARGDLRKYQLCNLSVLKTFDAICKKQGWTYWLYAGTLLGAVRHKGFIPWDDDIDVAMPRKDYDKAIKQLPEICASYGSDSLFRWGEILSGGLEYKPAGVCVDFFPCDEIYSDLESDNETENRKSIEKKLKTYQNFFYSHTKAIESLKFEIESEKMQTIITERNKIFYGNGKGIKYVVQEPEFIFDVRPEKPRIHRYDTIFPLKTVQFEGFTFPSPANQHLYLLEQFGSDYMFFPRQGALHHGGIRAIERGFNDLDLLLEKLQAIEKFFTSQI